MSDFFESQLELDRSRDFFADPASYRPFDLDGNLRQVVGCIDPRDQASNRLLTVVQTAGAGVGVGTDTAIGLTITTGQPVTIETGIAVDKNARHSVKLCAHGDCRYIKGLGAILDEMAAPSDFTRDSVDRWTSFYELGEEITPGVLKIVGGAVTDIQEAGLSNEEELISYVDKLYPTPNVATMSGENTAKIYVVNHLPNAGLNRHKKHREVGLSVQGYHDSLGAVIADEFMSRTPSEERRYRVGSTLLRAAAVRTVISSQQPDMVFLEAQMTEQGPQIIEISA